MFLFILISWVGFNFIFLKKLNLASKPNLDLGTSGYLELNVVSKPI